MAITGADSDCKMLVGVREVHFRALNADGSADTDGDWYATDCPIEVGFDPEIKEGKSIEQNCGDVLKNEYRTTDQLKGISAKFTMGCHNPEIENIIAGSVGTVTYDESSPPIPVKFTPPTLEEQADALDFEMRVYRANVDGSNEVGFEEYWLYQCKPAFPKIGGNQDEYGTQEWTIAAVENASYEVGGKPVYEWEILAAIPT